jgi:hypothetical protein
VKEKIKLLVFGSCCCVLIVRIIGWQSEYRDNFGALVEAVHDSREDGAGQVLEETMMMIRAEVKRSTTAAAAATSSCKQ